MPKPRKAIARSTKPIARSLLKRTRRTRISPMSAGRRAEMAERRAVVAQVHARDRTCQAVVLVPHVACAGLLAVHEPKLRSRGGDYLDPDACVLLCAAHHSWTHSEPAKATALGLMRSAFG